MLVVDSRSLGFDRRAHRSFLFPEPFPSSTASALALGFSSLYPCHSCRLFVVIVGVVDAVIVIGLGVALIVVVVVA